MFSESQVGRLPVTLPSTPGVAAGTGSGVPVAQRCSVGGHGGVPAAAPVVRASWKVMGGRGQGTGGQMATGGRRGPRGELRGPEQSLRGQTPGSATVTC